MEEKNLFTDSFCIRNNKFKVIPLTIFLLTCLFVGCIGHESVENSSQASNGADVSEEADNLDVNYSAIEVLPPYDESESEWLKTDASNIARIALKDNRARQLIQEGGTIMGVTYSCHPTPENYDGPGCAPALRIQSGNKIVDFLVDEEKGVVVETVTEIRQNTSTVSID
jgi:hypothetical protein